jgi:hypothetical protein
MHSLIYKDVQTDDIKKYKLLLFQGRGSKCVNLSKSQDMIFHIL